MIQRLSRRTNLVFGVVDQGVSSLTNLGLSVAVASTSGDETFGALAVVVALYLLEYGIVYGAIVEPYSVAESTHDDDSTRQAVAAAVVGGLVLASAHLIAASLASGTLAAFLIAYALATPGLVVQVSARGLLIAAGRSRVTFESNLIWAVVQIGLTVVAFQSDSSLGVFLAWAAGGWASAAYCLWHLGAGPRIRAWRSWFRGRTRLAVSWAGDYLAQQGMAQVVVFSLGAVAGLTDVASYRGALLLTGPATVVVEGLRQVILAGAARRARAGDGSLSRAIMIVAVALPATAFALMAPFLFLPDELGDRMLGETWDGARAILPWIIVMRTASAVVAAYAIGMRATQEHRATLYLRVAGGVSMLVAATAAGARWGAMGASVALALVAILLIPFWWLSLTRHVASLGRSSATSTRGEPEPIGTS